MEKMTVKEFFIKTLNGMAHGLFATLIIGTIFGMIGSLFAKGAGNPFCDFMYGIIGNGSIGEAHGFAWLLQMLTGAGIGVGIALVLGFKPLEVVSLAAVGQITAYFSLNAKLFVEQGGQIADKFQIGDPLTIYLAVISTALLMKLVLRKKTPVDILIIPLFTIIVGTIFALLIRFPAIYVTFGVKWITENATNAVPFLMGIIISVLMGMALTAPISSAAIAAMIFSGVTQGDMTSGLAIASGAAIVGCCTQMIGFAVQSRKDNPLGMVFSIGIGTSMLQFKNIIKKPIIWLPTIIASAILGPISTCWLHLSCGGSNAGMGTAGLVGILGTIDTMGNVWQTYVGVIVLELIAPAILVFLIDLLFRKLGWIKEGDLKV